MLINALMNSGNKYNRKWQNKEFVNIKAFTLFCSYGVKLIMNMRQGTRILWYRYTGGLNLEGVFSYSF